MESLSDIKRKKQQAAEDAAKVLERQRTARADGEVLRAQVLEDIKTVARAMQDANNPQKSLARHLVTPTESRFSRRKSDPWDKAETPFAVWDMERSYSYRVNDSDTKDSSTISFALGADGRVYSSEAGATYRSDYPGFILVWPTPVEVCDSGTLHAIRDGLGNLAMQYDLDLAE